MDRGNNRILSGEAKKSDGSASETVQIPRHLTGSEAFVGLTKLPGLTLDDNGKVPHPYHGEPVSPQEARAYLGSRLIVPTDDI